MRKKRELLNGARYHVIGKINRGEFLFKTETIKELFMAILVRAKKKFNFNLGNFCIMDNHVHFIIEPLEGTTLPQIMQWILSVFAMKYNKTNGIHGHVWYDRYKSKVIKDRSHLKAVLNYINDNPVKAGIVDNILDYIYCGCYHFIQSIKDLLDVNTYKIIFEDDIIQNE